MKPINEFVNPMLNDKYQLTMAYAYWKTSRHNDHAVFDLFFRKNPFKGEFTIFAGLEEVLKFVSNFKFRDNDIDYLQHGLWKTLFVQIKEFESYLANGVIRRCSNGYERLSFAPHSQESTWLEIEYPSDDIYVEAPLEGCDPEFFDWLKSVDCSNIKVYAIAEGSLAFPREPLLRIEGPLAVVQMLETTSLNLINYACLLTTNATRFRLAVGWKKILLEFGLRRAQGPDGAISASKYSFIGGFNGTSNVRAGQLFRVPIKGTHAHSFVQSFVGLADIKNVYLKSINGKKVDFVELVCDYRRKFGYTETNLGELSAFIAYAQAFPREFLALVDTYDTLKSGTPNFICVAAALQDLGYQAIGIRLDSGDLAYLSREARKMFKKAEVELNVMIGTCIIVASNDINENTLHALNEQGHEIDSFGVGTNLVTCQAQPALGGVFKLVEINGEPRIKLSQDVIKVTFPGRKEVYRLLGKEGYPIIDLMIQVGEAPPKIGERIFCQHPFDETKRAYVNPSDVIPLHKLVWDCGKFRYPFPEIIDTREYILDQLMHFRKDHLRLVNPTPYKVAVSEKLNRFLHDLWVTESPVTELN